MSNPPDKYIAIPLTGDLVADLDAINAAADEGYRFAGQIVAGDGPRGAYTAVILGNYEVAASS